MYIHHLSPLQNVKLCSPRVRQIDEKKSPSAILNSCALSLDKALLHHLVSYLCDKKHIETFQYFVYIAGGFGSYIFGMSEVIAKQSTEANAADNIKNPSLGWMIIFLFVVSFLGLFSVVPLRKVNFRHL